MSSSDDNIVLAGGADKCESSSDDNGVVLSSKSAVAPPPRKRVRTSRPVQMTGRFLAYLIVNVSLNDSQYGRLFPDADPWEFGETSNIALMGVAVLDWHLRGADEPVGDSTTVMRRMQRKCSQATGWVDYEVADSFQIMPCDLPADEWEHPYGSKLKLIMTKGVLRQDLDLQGGLNKFLGGEHINHYIEIGKQLRRNCMSIVSRVYGPSHFSLRRGTVT